MSKTDLRIIKTKNAIKTAFIELINEKGYANITVTDIAAKAMINRKTFYTHYETKEALYDSIANELINIISPVFEAMPHLKGIEQRKYVSALLNRFKKHKDIFNTLINDKTSSEFYNRLKTNLNYNLINKSHIDKKTVGTNFSTELLTQAYLAIFITFARWWTTNSDLSADELIDLIIEFFSKRTLELLGISFDRIK